MAGQATIIIGREQWAVSVANTPSELTTGLSGLESIPAGTGMLFDLGAEYRTIQIDMSQMLFPLDIIFINSSWNVVGVIHDVQPEDRDVEFEGTYTSGARYFLEVNAGEAEDISVGDSVSISGDVQPAFWAGLVAAVQALAVIAVVAAGAYKAVKQELAEAKEKK